MKFNIISVMSDLISQGIGHGVIGSAFKKGIAELNLINPRQFTEDVHQSVDDRPFGGGDGMLMLAEPLERSLCSIEEKDNVYYLSPQGELFDDKMAREWSQEKQITLICGRYGGVDQRFLNKNKIKEISIGDYILSGGELAALVIIDATLRHCSGVLGHVSSADQDSFSDGLLESPYFTRPQNWQGLEVPNILLSGDHKKITDYRKQMSLIITLIKRPELLHDKKINWQECYTFLKNQDSKELYFLDLSKENILKLIEGKRHG
jgi:tRNA (guanine37-N1)-methyltransferase